MAIKVPWSRYPELLGNTWPVEQREELGWLAWGQSLSARERPRGNDKHRPVNSQRQPLSENQRGSTIAWAELALPWLQGCYCWNQTQMPLCRSLCCKARWIQPPKVLLWKVRALGGEWVSACWNVHPCLTHRKQTILSGRPSRSGNNTWGVRGTEAWVEPLLVHLQLLVHTEALSAGNSSFRETPAGLQWGCSGHDHLTLRQ